MAREVERMSRRYAVDFIPPERHETKMYRGRERLMQIVKKREGEFFWWGLSLDLCCKQEDKNLFFFEVTNHHVEGPVNIKTQLSFVAFKKLLEWERGWVYGTYKGGADDFI
jgi:hypothetical protein